MRRDLREKTHRVSSQAAFRGQHCDVALRTTHKYPHPVMPPHRRGPAEPDDSEEAVPGRPWPGEQPLPPELLADSRGAAYTAACALQESSRETEALCAPWPVPWAALVEAQGQDGSAAALEQELDAALVDAAQRTAAGGVPPSQIEAVRAKQPEHCQSTCCLTSCLPRRRRASTS